MINSIDIYEFGWRVLFFFYFADCWKVNQKNWQNCFQSKSQMNSNMRSNGPLLDESILSLDPDKIFELQNIDQVKELVRKLQHETDRKREELRQELMNNLDIWVKSWFLMYEFQP